METTEKTRNKILQEWKKHRFTDYCSHPSLKSLGVCSGYVGPDEECDFEEISFAVPEKWLIETCIREFDELKLPSDVQYFLDNVYTSDHSIVIFELAMSENQIAMLNFN